jgi:HD-like signal output (HDOD) protein
VTVQPIKPEPAKPSVSDIKERIEKITELPPMPEMAQKIVLLNANPYARAEDLARLVELDPSLAAQIVRYARSPFFGYRGQISSIKDAIARVLGYDMVMNIALGMAAASPFKIPKSGVLGLEAFWLHATFTAALTQELGKVVPKNLRPKPGITYLAGLLHNFGFLLLGHLFTDEFNALNKAVSANPDRPIMDLEIEMLGADHAEIGAWLMKAWNMPEEVIVTMREHHNVQYQDKHAVYPNLVLLADRILKKYGLGDAAEIDLPESFIQKYNLNEMRLEPVINRFLEGREDLESIARVLAA